MPSVPGKMGNHSSERAAVLESLTSKVTSFVLFSANPSAILWEYGLWKYAASRILLPKLRIYFVLAKSGVSMSGPHVGSIPIFLLDSHMDVWFTPVLVPNVFINLPVAPPDLSLPHLNIISLGWPLSRTAFILSATSDIASSHDTLFHWPPPLGPVLRMGYKILSGS